MIEPIATNGVFSNEALASIARVNQLQTLAMKASEATSPAGEESFAAALAAATESGAGAAEAGMQPEPIPGAEVEAMPGTEPEAIPQVAVESSSGSALPDSTAAVPGAETESIPGTTIEAPSGLGASAPTGYASAIAGYPQSIGAPPGLSSTPSAGIPPSPAASQATTAGDPSPYEPLIQQAAIRNGVEPALLKGLIEQESGFDPNARSSAGALGLTQLMPSTAASLGVSEPLNPSQSIEGGARLLGQLLRQFGGNVSDALAAYNAGAGAVQRYGGVPPYPETEAYVAKVLANARAYAAPST